MSEARVYSDRLGPISDAQFEAVATRLGLGRFLSAEPITSGLFGQNAFMTTTQGTFVLRGAPHWVKVVGETEYRREDGWQFTKEKYFAEQLHLHTQAPVPWPMLHDESSDIFGWPYLVMPRIPGRCFSERDILKSLDFAERHAVAVALGEMLAEMQTLTSPFAGDFSTTTIELEPYPGGAVQHVVDETMAQVSMANAHGIVTDQDRALIDSAASAARASQTELVNTYVHCDYKLNNLTIAKQQGRWRVSGLFDLHEARFGDGTLDIVRQACSYLDTEPALVPAFIDAYRANIDGSRIVPERMILYVLNDRMKFWEYFARPEQRAKWTLGTTFGAWSNRYVNALMKLL